MGAAQRGAEGHPVALCKEVFNREVKIGEGREEMGSRLYKTQNHSVY